MEEEYRTGPEKSCSVVCGSGNGRCKRNCQTLAYNTLTNVGTVDMWSHSFVCIPSSFADCLKFGIAPIMC